MKDSASSPEKLYLEVLNYKKASLFAREVLLLVNFDRIIDLSFAFLRNKLGCENLGLVKIAKGFIEKHIILENQELTALDIGIESQLVKQIELGEELLHFEGKKPFSSLLLQSRGEYFGFIIIFNNNEFKKNLEEPGQKKLLNLFLSYSANALRGADESDRNFNRKLVDSQIVERDRINRLNEKLEIASRAKSEFIARMSHEMRTPLNVILGLVDTLLERSANTPDLELIQVLKNAGSGLLMLINDVLDISKIEANELQLDPQQINFYEFIEQTVTIFQAKAKQKTINLHFNIGPLVPRFVFGDPLRLRQIIYNLLGNALKFTSQGEVYLNIKPFDKRDHILFEVSDTGVGLSKSQKSKIFEPFVQGDESTTRNYGGTGLGLSIAKKIVNLMGGNIYVTDNARAGVGSVFFFDCYLPETIRPVEQIKKIAYDQNFLEKEIKILAADDSLDNQLLLRVFLKKTNFELVMVSDGLEALEQFKSNKFDVVLMDMQMPIMGGLEATMKIREFEKAHQVKATPILALTADAVVEHANDMHGAGCNEVVTKPVNKNGLLESLYRWTQAKAS